MNAGFCLLILIGLSKVGVEPVLVLREIRESRRLLGR